MKFSSHISTIFVTPTDDAGTTKVQKQKKICIFVMFNVRKPSFGEEPPEHRPGSLRQMLQGRNDKTEHEMHIT